MNYGLYLSASGLLTNRYRQGVYANNLANVNTVAFKPDLAAVQARPSESVEDNLRSNVSRKLLDQLGGGVKAAPQRINFTAGPVQDTGRLMDVYIQDERGFFAVRDNNAEGNDVTRYTRDGRVFVSDEGRLVNANGLPLLDEGEREINVPENTPLRIEANGDVTADGNPVARLGVFRIADATALEKAGGNLFGLKRDTAVDAIDRPTLHPGKPEGSAADPISTLMQLIAATKAATGNARMIQYHDTLMDRAINTLGRVA